MFNEMGPLGMALSQSLMPQHPEAQPMPQLSKGQLIAGILADALKGAAGQAPIFAPMMERRRAEADDEIRWRNRLEESERIKHQYPDPSPMERDLSVWQHLNPEQREAYKAMKQASAGDPDVFVTLPNGQVYSGPKSGLSQALMGGGQAPPRPVGPLTPINGGPTPQASGGFPRY